MRFAVVGVLAALLASFVQFAQAQGVAAPPLRDPRWRQVPWVYALA
jgi:hypothetical protein